MLFRASSMPRLVPCPGSNLQCQPYPNDSGEEADEGTVAHQVSAETLRSGGALAEHIGRSIDNVFVDQEMVFHLELYVAACRAFTTTGLIEHPYLMMFEGHSIQGTPDFWLFNATTGILHVFDLKYGFGWIEVHENWQLLTYAMLILYSYPELRELVKEVCLTVVQPRASHPAGPVRSWTLDADSMRNYQNFILGAVRDAAMPEPVTTSGAHCRYCLALLDCNTATAASGLAVDYSGKAGLSKMTPQQFALDMEITQRAKKMLDQRFVALEEVGLNMCKKGTIIPGWEGRQTVSALKWKADRDVVKIAEAMKVDIKAPEKPITPTQAIQRGVLSEAVVKSMASRTAGGIKLKRVDHARARRILGNG